MFNEMIVEALYRLKLDRVPNATEMAHWLNVLRTTKPGLFAEHIATSPEAREVELRRQQSRKRNSLDGRQAELAVADQYFADLCSAIDDRPTRIHFSEAALSALPAWQWRRMASSPLLDLAPADEGGAAIRCVSAAEYRPAEARADRESALMAEIVLLNGPSATGHPDRFTYRLSPREAALPLAGMAAGIVDLRGPVFPRSAPRCDAVIFEKEGEPYQQDAAGAARILTALTLGYFFRSDFIRVMMVLDDWDKAMGTDLSLRFQAFSGFLR
jgi:hypothetical protein